MFEPKEYLNSLTTLLKAYFRNRLRYIGLQGSYLREEATEDSDIDIMVVIDGFSPADMELYRVVIKSLERPEKSCGFICGTEELRHWNPLEICHLVHATKDYFGTLKELVPAYTQYDVQAFIKMSLGNLFHEICHRRIHASREENEQALPTSYKGVFFILQNLHYLETDRFIGTKQELLASLTGQDRLVLETAIALANGEPFDFDGAFALLYSWCQEVLARTSSIAGASL